MTFEVFWNRDSSQAQTVVECPLSDGLDRDGDADRLQAGAGIEHHPPTEATLLGISMDVSWL